MALVAYDYSDDSDDNESEDVAEIGVILKKDFSNVKNDSVTPDASKTNSVESTLSADFKLPACKSTSVEDDAEDNDSDSDEDESIDISFSNLHKPQYDTLYVDESKLKSSKSEIWKKLISLPRVNKSVTSIERSSLKKINKESGLLSLLPSPTCESTKTTEITISNTKLLPRAVKNNLKSTSKSSAKKNDDGDEENSVSETDFFSLSKVDKVQEYDISTVNLDIVMGNSMNDVDVPSKSDISHARISQLAKYLREDEVTNEQETESANDVNLNPDSQNHLDLDEDAVQKLCGRKRKGQIPDNIQVIDIHEDSILAERKRDLTKRLTEEVSYRPLRASGPSTVSKRKHQITYLAYQAKERELELKNQWAQNRFTKKQTQSKYGF